MNKTPIVGSEVSKRNRDKQLLKEQQNKEMQLRPVETTSKKKPLEETLWRKICRQVGKPELTTNTLFESTNRWGVNVSALQRKRTI